VTKCKVV